MPTTASTRIERGRRVASRRRAPARVVLIVLALNCSLLLASCRAQHTAARCVGVPMERGQADIDAHAPGTRFCLSGSHNWTLNPKDGDSFIGPATLDGKSSKDAAFVGTARNVTLANLTVQHYDGGDQRGAINPDDAEAASGWTLNDLDVGYNANVGVVPGARWSINGGRFHHNGQEGLGGDVGDHVVVDGSEIDHNNTHDVSCGYEAGGFKWVADDVTVRNSSIHHNRCKGLWADLNASGTRITGNRVYDNWDEGIFIEISNGASVTHNTVAGNGWRNYNGSGTGCPWLWGGGITVSSSANVDVAHNIVTHNCNGITGIQQHRPDGRPGVLEHLSVHDNLIVGNGISGIAEDNGSTRVFTTCGNQFVNNRFVGGGFAWSNSMRPADGTTAKRSSSALHCPPTRT
jgi:parallel beta-helix repeat protein